MTEHHRTLLDDLDQAPVGSAPVAHLVAGARAARRRKQRTLVAGAAAVTALAVGGGVLTTQALTGTSDNNIAGAPGQEQNLDVNVVSGVSEPVLDSFAEPLTGAAAAWNPTDETLVYVSGMNYSSSCPPEGTATVVPDTKVVALTLRDYEGTGVCTSDAGRVTVTVDGLTTPPAELTVTADGETTTLAVDSFTGDEYQPSVPAPLETTRCNKVRLPEGGLGEADFNVDKQRGLLDINFSETRGGTYRNIAYTVEYRTDPTCASTPAMADLIAQVIGYDVASTDPDVPTSPTESDKPTLLCDPGEGTPQPQPGCPEPRPTTGWLTVTETGDIVIRHFRTLHNDADGKAYARREGLEFPFANDYLDVPDGSSQTLQLTTDTACSGINQVDYRSPLGDHPVQCSELLDAAEAHRVPVAVWRDGPTIVQVSELYRP